MNPDEANINNTKKIMSYKREETIRDINLWGFLTGKRPGIGA